ncbi:hypothetical protein RHMOL_Rhmol08G0189800 [Rhododendron molle]|uniref:Uncharacterized protein n=1 Tax=Rhododendron molle TaxID=49168 RepID=A0ACC0MR90_RHOML|nr:hypothetical protein RHMOL_Rhmol08G0189800 [Rhododendron molle]
MISSHPSLLLALDLPPRTEPRLHSFLHVSDAVLREADDKIERNKELFFGGKGSSKRIVRECRICQEEDEEHEMEAPCTCNETLKMIQLFGFCWNDRRTNFLPASFSRKFLLINHLKKMLIAATSTVTEKIRSSNSDLVLKYQWFVGERTPSNFIAIPKATGEVMVSSYVNPLPPSRIFLFITGDYCEGGIFTASYGYIGGHEGKSTYNWYLHELLYSKPLRLTLAPLYRRFQVSFNIVLLKMSSVNSYPLNVSQYVMMGLWVSQELAWGRNVFNLVTTSFDGNQTEVKYATTTSYILSVDDIGFFVSVSCEPVRRPPTHQSLKILRSFVEGQRLSFIASYSGGEKGDCFYEWFRLESNGVKDKLNAGGKVLGLAFGGCLELVYTPVCKDGVKGSVTCVLSTAVSPGKVDCTSPNCDLACRLSIKDYLTSLYLLVEVLVRLVPANMQSGVMPTLIHLTGELQGKVNTSGVCSKGHIRERTPELRVLMLWMIRLFLLLQLIPKLLPIKRKFDSEAMVNPQGVECLSLRLNSHLLDFVISERYVCSSDDVVILRCADLRGCDDATLLLCASRAYVSYMDFCFLGIELDSEGMLLSLWPA